MNPIRYDIQIHRDADRIRSLAQQTGDAVAYIQAAELYERCGDFDKARICREAAEKLAK